MNAFLVYILKVALFTAVFVLLYHLLLRRDTFHRTTRMVLVSSLVVSYILPFCVITIHRPAPVVENSQTAPVQTSVQTLVPATMNTVPDSYPAQVQTHTQMQSIAVTVPSHKHIDWMQIIFIIYCIGTTSLILLRLVSIRQVRTLIRRGRVVKETAGYKIVISKDNIRPFSWMHYIVLPEEYADLSCAQAVICHEYSHISHHHSMELLVTDILSAFQWFNSAVWLLRHDLCCVQEFQADASVLESGLDRGEYEMALLNMVTGGLSIPLVNGLGESSLHSRIRMMNRKLSGRFSLLKLAYLPIVLTVALVLMSNTVYDLTVNTSSEPMSVEEPIYTVSEVDEIEPEFELAETNEDEFSETDVPFETDATETVQTLSALFDGSLLEYPVARPLYQEQIEIPRNLPDIMLDNLKKQYPELNSLESIYDDGILTNDKPYKGYISCIQMSKGVYSFWVMGLEDKGGQVVSIELGTIDNAIAFLDKLITSYQKDKTISAQGHTFTAVKGNAYSIPRTDGVDLYPYLISVKNLKHDLSVLEKRKNWGTAAFDEIGFFTMENKPDHYEVLYPSSPITYEYLETNVWEGVDGGEEWAATELEKQIRERGSEGHVPGKVEWVRSRFNGVILLSFQKSEYMKQSGAYREYRQYYIPIIYDPVKYQAPLTDYQRGLKRSVFRRKK